MGGVDRVEENWVVFYIMFFIMEVGIFFFFRGVIMVKDLEKDFFMNGLRDLV